MSRQHQEEDEEDLEEIDIDSIDDEQTLIQLVTSKKFLCNFFPVTSGTA